MDYCATESLFMFIDVQHGFARVGGSLLVRRLTSLHAQVTGLGLPVWHVEMRSKTVPERQASVDRVQAALLKPAPDQPVFAKDRMAPDDNPAFKAALIAAEPKLVIACGYFFDKCVTATARHVRETLGYMSQTPEILIVDDLCGLAAPKFFSSRSTRRRWLYCQKPCLRLVDSPDVELSNDRVLIADPAPARPGVKQQSDGAVQLLS